MARPLPEPIAVQPAAFGDREFGEHAGLELDAIIAGLGMFVRITLAKALAGLFDRSGFELQFAPRRHHEDVEHVADAGAREMRMAEPHDRAIFLVIARAGVPAMGVRIGAQLRHAERQRRAGKGMAVAAGADEEIGLADGKRAALAHGARARSEEPTSELQSLKLT